MFKPKYTLTKNLLNNVNEIERLYGRFEGLNVPQNLLLNLERDNLIQSAYVSNSIEGNPLTLAEVTNLLLNDRVPANRNEKEVANYFQILKSLENQANAVFDLKLICKIHQELMTGVDDDIKGQIRNKQVVVGKQDSEGRLLIKHRPPFHSKQSIEKLVNKLTEWFKVAEELPPLKIGIFHHQFVYIHPFADGNGRVCRLLTTLLFLKHNYLINKYFVLDDYYDIDREGYSDALHSADAGNQTRWLEYFTNGIKYSLQSALGRIETGLTTLTFDIRPTPREQAALEIISKYRQVNTADLVKELKVTRQQAFNLLRSLLKKGYIEKKGQTKSSYYLLK